MIEEAEQRIGSFNQGDVPPSTIVRSLQTAMWEGAGIFRNGPDLQKTLGIIRHLQTLRPKAASAANFAECFILQNMLTTASLVVRSALLRKESRGAHLRRDITQNWDPEHSPYGHTYLSLSREGIETRAVK